MNLHQLSNLPKECKSLQLQRRDFDLCMRATDNRVMYSKGGESKTGGYVSKQLFHLPFPHLRLFNFNSVHFDSLIVRYAMLVSNAAAGEKD